ncbi:uncharacterized protein TAF1C-like isoform X2 [Venturia canescens]|uniref:uncharacterized protein TAF1C-like isoform X2 n=1 Tax=Venturia canescens TaxID=32260 RepID=UPI001C9D035F|nr:uncharacterized protein LOC122414069 isoform X2 [Venturia canescens]
MLKHILKRMLKEFCIILEDAKMIPSKNEIIWKAVDGNIRTSAPKYVADLAALIEMDPDPYFAGMYNWYYTGGSLSNVSVGGQSVLIFPYMDDLVATHIIPVKNSLHKPSLRTAATCQLNDSIYEIRTNLERDNRRILARAKNNCIIYSLAETHGKLRLFQIENKKSRLPYVSADLDPLNHNRFCSVDVERTLTLWDVLSGKKIGSNHVEITKPLEDKWACVKIGKKDPNSIVFVDRCCLHYLDVRESYERPVLSLCPSQHLEACESLCSAVPSINEDHYYMASYHSLLLCDRRSPQLSVQQKWTHQFKSPPLFADVHTRNEKEVIILSNQIAGEITIILNTWDGRDSSHSLHLPYTPPSVLNTLSETQMQGKCLDPLLKKRLALSTSGICTIADENAGTSLFVRNSIGDIFYQCIKDEIELDHYSMINCESTYAMEAWEKQLLLQERLKTPLILTDRTNMHHPFDNFMNKTARIERNLESDDLLETNPKWQESLDKLKKYVDILAPELLAVWDVTEASVPDSQTVIPHDRVLNWLETANETTCTIESQEYPEFMPTPINTQELFSASQQPEPQPEVIDIIEDVPTEAYFPPVVVKTSKKAQPKKRMYVAGF